MLPVFGQEGNPMKSAGLIALMLIAIPLMPASAAWGQGGNPSASTKESGAISGHGMTAVEQTAKDSGGSVELQIKTLHEQSLGQTPVSRAKRTWQIAASLLRLSQGGRYSQNPGTPPLSRHLQFELQ